MAEYDVQLWRAEVSANEAGLGRLEALLPPEEVEAASRFQFPAGRARFIIGRSMLRSTLSRTHGIDPNLIEVEIAAGGKPHLAGEAASGGWQFNLSHSGDIVLLALGQKVQLGIDVERVRPLDRRDQIAAGILSRAQNQQFLALDEEHRQLTFFHVWTQKESIIKATGQGLAVPLSEIDVSISLDRTQLIRWGDDLHPTAWELQPVDCGPQYFAALAADRPVNFDQPRCWSMLT